MLIKRHDGKITLRTTWEWWGNPLVLLIVKWATITVGTFAKIASVAFILMFAYDISTGSVFLAMAVISLLVVALCRNFVLYINSLRWR